MTERFQVYPGQDMESDEAIRFQEELMMLTTPPPSSPVSPYPDSTPDGVLTQVKKARKPLGEIQLQCSESALSSVDSEGEDDGGPGTQQSNLSHLFPHFTLHNTSQRIDSVEEESERQDNTTDLPDYVLQVRG